MMYEGETVAFAFIPRKASSGFPPVEYGMTESRRNAPMATMMSTAAIAFWDGFKVWIEMYCPSYVFTALSTAPSTCCFSFRISSTVSLPKKRVNQSYEANQSEQYPWYL
jgi:hypothetical protein